MHHAKNYQSSLIWNVGKQLQFQMTQDCRQHVFGCPYCLKYIAPLNLKITALIILHIQYVSIQILYYALPTTYCKCE